MTDSPTKSPATAIADRPTICHVIHALGVGGAEVLVDQMVRRMSDEFHCVVAVLDEIGEIGERLRADGYRVEHLHRAPGVDYRCARRLREFADREGAQLLHAHQYTPFFQSMLSRGLFGRRPVVFTEHGRHVPDFPSRKRSVVNRLLLRKCDRLIGCGEAVRQALIRNEGLPAERVEVILNGVDLNRLSHAAADARLRIRTEFGFRDSDFVAVQVARLHELKDHQTALRTASIVRQSLPGFRLLVVGDGDQRGGLEQTIAELGLEQTVTLAGTRTDIADLLAAADVFLLTSISEGIPLTVIEAMAARRPVVATSVGGLPELVAHGVSGSLAPAGDANGLAAALLCMANDPHLRTELAEAGWHRAQQQFSLDGMLDNYRAVYREVLHGGHPASPASAPRDSSMQRVESHWIPACAGMTGESADRAGMTDVQSSSSIGSLIVFSDDWGRHASSCQHLVQRMLDRSPVLWVNTIGTRAPRLDMQTARRVFEKLTQWSGLRRPATSNAVDQPITHRNLNVISPRMWPWFSRPVDRRINLRLLSRQLNAAIRELPKPVVALTTLPITADLPNTLHVDRWVYYCVDDFSQWPGLDRDTLRRMDRDMIRRADSLIAVSETLQGMIAAEGRTSSLLTHGVDVDFWARPNTDRVSPIAAMPGPRIVFWGVIDRRMDTPTLQQLSRDLPQSSIILIGPQQDPDPAVLSLPNIHMVPAQPLSALPAIARDADVLIMPYANLPVTRAMQPLKLKEYLATGKPVVVNQLPSTDDWADGLDAVSTPAQFSAAVRERIAVGLPASQRDARRRLIHETWNSKADILLRVLEHRRQTTLQLASNPT